MKIPPFHPGWRRQPAGWLLGAALCLAGAQALAVELVTLEFSTQALDLDTGTVEETLTAVPGTASGGDVRLAYHADRATHAVIVPHTDGVALAYVAGVGFDGVSAADLDGLAFSPEPADVPFTANDVVVIVTDAGGYYRLGNAVESGRSVTFNYAPLE